MRRRNVALAALLARQLMFAAARVQPKRTASTAAASSPSASRSAAVAVFIQRAANRRQTAPVSRMFAASDTHWKATPAAMYFLLSPTMPISRLSIIFLSPCAARRTVSHI